MIENLSANEIGNRIKERLKELNMKQKDLTTLADLSKNAISNYISGNRVPDTNSIYKISNVLNVSIEWLLSGTKTVDTVHINNQPDGDTIYYFVEAMLVKDESLKKLPITKENLIYFKNYLETATGFKLSEDLMGSQNLTVDEFECLRLFNMLDDRKKQRALGYLDSQVCESKFENTKQQTSSISTNGREDAITSETA